MTTARLAGALIGVALAAVLLLIARPSASFQTTPATVRLSVTTTGELEVTPPSPVVATGRLRPGSGFEVAEFAIRNQTGSRLGVAFRAHAESTALDGLLRVRLRSDGKTLADTTLQGLRNGSASSIQLPPGGKRRLELSAWISQQTTDGYQGQLVEVSLIPVIEGGGDR